jgi:hypothetical protein
MGWNCFLLGNQRRFVLTRGGQHTPYLEAAAASEFQYVSDLIWLAPFNEATWSYARALPMGSNPSCLEKLEYLATEVTKLHPNNVHSLSVLADAAIARAEQAKDPNTLAASVASALKALQELMKLDPMRERYWAWCAHLLEARAGCSSP